MAPRRPLAAIVWLFVAVSITFSLYFLSYWHDTSPPQPPSMSNAEAKLTEENQHLVPGEIKPLARPKGPIYKDPQENEVGPPIKDNFPLADTIFSREDFPAIPSWNKPPDPHISEKTPLFIGFTRGWPMLQQAVVSYVTAGWPPEDIYVVENTGTMYSNKQALLSLQNPFFLNHTRLELFGINVLITPTLLTFAQLQNYYIFQALERGWDYYFWSHMDIIALTDEKLALSSSSSSSPPPPPPTVEEPPLHNFYTRAVDVIRNVTSPHHLLDSATGQQKEWAIQFLAHDRLALNNVKSFVKVGGWDTFISFYTGDCDIHARFKTLDIALEAVDAGLVSDVTGTLDLNLLFRRKVAAQGEGEDAPRTAKELDAMPEDERGGEGFQKLRDAIGSLRREKGGAKEREGGHSWQYLQSGGEGDPFYKNPRGFEKALQMLISSGVKTFEGKWGHQDCKLLDVPLKFEDAGLVKHDWE